MMNGMQFDRLMFLMMVQSYATMKAISEGRASTLPMYVMAAAMDIDIANIPEAYGFGGQRLADAARDVVEFQMQKRTPRGERTVDPPAWTGWE